MLLEQVVQLSELVFQLAEVSELIERVDLLLELIGQLGELVFQFAGIYGVMQLVELFFELLTALSELVAQSAEIAKLMELAQKLAEIAKIQQGAAVWLTGPVTLTRLVGEDGLTGQVPGNLRRVRRMAGLIRRMQCDCDQCRSDHSGGSGSSPADKLHGVASCAAHGDPRLHVRR